MQRFSLAGKRALVTGATRGIGKAIAFALAQAGASIIVGGRAGLDDCVAELRAAGHEASALALDVSSPSLIDAGFDALAARVDRLDILVNNAGIEEVCASDEVDEARWDRILGTNLKGAFFTARRAARLMHEGGAILNLCSLTSEVGIPGAVPYGASKSGMLGITRALATEWAVKNIRVNGIGPGYFRTGMTEVFYANEGWQQTMLGKIPMRRFGALEDLAGAAIFLCSPAAAYITGQVIYIDGGYLASI
jgi:gluconate 5-dehydrogenase